MRIRRATITTTTNAPARTSSVGNPPSSAKPVVGKAVTVGEGVSARSVASAAAVCWAGSSVARTVVGVAEATTTTRVGVDVFGGAGGRVGGGGGGGGGAPAGWGVWREGCGLF